MNRILVVAAMVVSATSLQAQAKRRIGYAGSAPPDQPAQPATRPQYAAPIYYEQGVTTVAAPFVVMSDGSILANFGGGYERVLRACAQGNQQPAQANVNGRDALGR